MLQAEDHPLEEDVKQQYELMALVTTQVIHKRRNINL